MKGKLRGEGGEGETVRGEGAERRRRKEKCEERRGVGGNCGTTRHCGMRADDARPEWEELGEGPGSIPGGNAKTRAAPRAAAAWDQVPLCRARSARCLPRLPGRLPDLDLSTQHGKGALGSQRDSLKDKLQGRERLHWPLPKR